MSSGPFADRLAALVEERRSQICLGLDPDPVRLGPGRTGAASEAGGGASSSQAAELAAGAIEAHCLDLIEQAGPACVAIKPQLACFERLGAPGWLALSRVCSGAQTLGLLVIADGKRGDVPVTAAAYAQSLIGHTPTPWGPVNGLGVDALTANTLLGRDSIEPLLEAAVTAGAGIFGLARTSNPGAADIEDLPSGDGTVHERIAAMIDSMAGPLTGSCGLSGMGAVVGATEPRHLQRMRELMPNSIFLIPGVGAQGGDPRQLGAAFSPGPAAAVIAASRSIAGAQDPAAAADALRETVWSVSAR